MTTDSIDMPFYDSPEAMVALDWLPGERGFALVGAGALGLAERLFGSGLAIGVAAHRPWKPGAPQALVIPVTAERIEIRIPDREPWASLLAGHLADLAEPASFGRRLAQAISRLEAWHESDTDSGSGPEELAAELLRLRRLAPSPQSGQAIGDAVEALDDGLPVDVVAAALYRALGQKTPG
jgi:hypothetical protein